MRKLCLIFFSVFTIAAIVSAWDNEEDSNLSKELAPSRLVRSADVITTSGPADTTSDPTTTTTTTSKGYLFNFLSLSLGIYISLSQSSSVGQSVKV